MLNKTIYVVFPWPSTRVQCCSEMNCIYFGHESRRAQGTLGFLNQTWLFPGPPHISALLKENRKRAAALTDSWSSCAEIQTSSSAWCRWADRWTETETGPSYRLPFSTEKDRGLGSSYICLKWFDFSCLLVLTASTTISCLRNVLCGFRIWQRKNNIIRYSWGQTSLHTTVTSLCGISRTYLINVKHICKQNCKCTEKTRLFLYWQN